MALNGLAHEERSIAIRTERSSLPLLRFTSHTLAEGSSSSSSIPARMRSSRRGGSGKRSHKRYGA